MSRLHILHVIASLGRGGAERQLVDCVRLMDRERYVNTVCHLYPASEMMSELEASGIPVIGLQLRGRCDALRAISLLYAVIRRHRFAIVHTWLYDADIFGRLAATLAGVRLIVSSLQNSMYEPGGLSSQVGRAKRSLLRGADMISARWCGVRMFACSALVKASVMKNLGIPASRIEVVYNAVDPDTFEIGEERLVSKRKELNLRNCFPIILCVGKLVREKGQVYLLRALPSLVREFPETRLLLVGQGSAELQLHEQVSRAGLSNHVIFLGTRTDVRDLLQLSNIYAFPSISEGLPVSVIEAMAAGKPCVGWAVPPNPEIIEDQQSGYLVPKLRTEAFAQALIALASKPALARQMGERGRAIVSEKFNLQRTVRQVERLYERWLLATSPM